MAENHIIQEGPDIPDFDNLREAKWTIAQSLLTANSRTTEALEYHLLATYAKDGTLDVETMQECLRQARDEHQKILEELRLAEAALAELEDEQDVTSRA